MLDKSAIIAQTPSRPIISQYGTVHQLPTGYSDRLYSQNRIIPGNFQHNP